MQLPELVDQVDSFLASKDDQRLKSLLARLTAPEIAHVIDTLPSGKRKTFASLPPEKQAGVVTILSQGSRGNILPRLTDATIARFLHFLHEDEGTDVMQILPQKRRQHVLAHMHPDHAKRIEKLLMFGPETAGGLMDLNFIETSPLSTVGEVVETVREYAKQHKQVPVVLLHTVKGQRRVPVRGLISAPKHVPVEEISKPILAALHTTDREAVLDLMGDDQGDMLCVTDDTQKILGVIHLNDLLRIAEAEASEDVYRMGAVGLIDASYLESKFSTIWRKRVGWLSVLFVAELFTFTALSKFESSIAAVTALALFVPLCISTGGNSGSQAATLVTRAMALGHVTTRDWLRVLQREILMGLALGVTLGAVAFVRASLTPQHVLGNMDRWTIGLVISLSVGAICLWGTIVGSMLPIVFRKLGFDPAYASSPFVATFVDVTGIVIYFSIANAFILA